MKIRTFAAGALLALWLAMFIPQVAVLVTARGKPPELSENQFLQGILLLVPHIPGLMVLGAVCAVFRNACYVGQPLGTDEASAIVVMLGDAVAYFLFTYWIAKLILTIAAKPKKSLKVVFPGIGILAITSNVWLMVWMLWAKKPYYAYPVPRLSIASVVVAAATFLCLFWPDAPRRSPS